MGSGERPIGAAKGTQSDTEALCQTPPSDGGGGERDGKGRGVRGGRAAGMHWKGGRYPLPPPPPGRLAYAQPLSPRRQVPASTAFVTDSNRPPTASATPSNRLSNRFWGRLRGAFPSNASLGPGASGGWVCTRLGRERVGRDCAGPQGSIGMAVHQRREGSSPRTPWTPQTKGTIVGKYAIYRWEHRVGPFFWTQTFGSQTPPSGITLRNPHSALS